MKYIKPTYEELAERVQLAERKLDNIKHIEHLARYHRGYKMIQVANGLAFILKTG